MEPTTLTEMVAALEPRLRQALGSIIIELRPNATAEARLGIALHTRAERDTETDGVALTAWRQWPEVVRSLSMDVPIDAQIHALEASGMVGALDAVRIQGGGELRWRIKTHAGSAAERRAWAHAL